MTVPVRDILLLSQIPGIGPTRLRALINIFKSAEHIQHSSARDLTSVEGIERKTALGIAGFFKSASALHKAESYITAQLSKVNKTDSKVITLWDKEYPENLKKIYDPPPLLFLRGTMTPEDRYAIAIVGTRDPTPYGSTMAEKFSSELSHLGIPIISGLARGIDTIAHSTAIKNRNRTVAVIGSGIDVVYPPENFDLFQRIGTSGAVVSEFEMGTKPDAGNFPRRNRIISGIAIATIIVETGVNGGAMITASTALDQNREVFAVPAAVSDRKKNGTNILIKESKAQLIESVEDILETLGQRIKKFISSDEPAAARPLPEMTLFEQQLFAALTDEPKHIDRIAEDAKLSMSDALVHLLSLEFKGLVRQMRGKMFVKI
ncbi:MAG TPA: DNA-processing protein DprA [Bacteroidota bacterium]